MKYTFDKFQIQLVTKPNPSMKTANFQNTFKSRSSSKNRNIKTAQFNPRHNVRNQDYFLLKSQQLQASTESQTSNNIPRSQSLKSEMKQRYKNWLNSSNVSTSMKQKEYRIFQQKCFDLLSKKKAHSQASKKSQIRSSNTKGKILFDRNQKTIQGRKINSVEQMMNNIIEKFKNDSRQRSHVDKAQSKKNSDNQKQPEMQPFMTINNEFVQMTQSSQFIHQVHTNSEKKERPSTFKAIKSSELRRNYSQGTKDQSQFIKISDDAEDMRKSQDKCWKDVPDVTGVRVNRKVNKLGYPSINPLICTSLALSSPTRGISRNIMAFEHIKLTPYEKLTTSTGSFTKRKKIHLNKPSTVKKFMKFTKNSSDQQYNRKIKAFLDFLFKINFSNNIYINLQLSSLDNTISIANSRYKVYVGPGNNCLLIKSLLKRRQWLQVVDNISEEGIQFYWTQNKVHEVHQKQINSDNYRQSYRQQEIHKSHERKKSTIRQSSQVKQLNTKLLSINKADQVQNYIFPDGYQIPFQKEYQANIVSNHIPDNYVIGSKKNLFKTIHAYYSNIVKKDPFTIIPKTYHIKSIQDPQFRRFIKQNSKQPSKLWIVKPGQNTNRGTGIRLCPFSKIESLVKQKQRHPNGHAMTYIIQSYINRPFLYNGRKFDIRHYMLVTSVNGIMKVYWYRDGYIRTSSEIFDLQDHQNEFVHLTNDAIQMKSQNYGMYEPANKLSYSQFQRYLDYSFTDKGYSFENIIKEMKSIMIDVIKASYLNLDHERKRDNFQLFGFDFMIDNNFKPYLIQINFNPCLVVNCNVLNRIIPPLIQNTLRIGLDPLLPPKSHLPVNRRNNLSENYLKNLRYELIFDEASLETDIYNKPQLQDSQDQEQQYGDNGKEISQNVTF